MKRIIKKIIKAFAIFAFISALIFVAINIYVVSYAKRYMLTPQEAMELQNTDCIAVLGAHVREDGSPSLMLTSRLDMGIKLYEEGVSDKLLLTGDHGQHEYDEVNNMMQYVLENSDISKENVFLDHAGFSTYESAYRAKEVFKVEKAIFVTQQYHLYRAIYDARSRGIQAFGVASDNLSWPGMAYYKFREALAIFKDFLCCVFDIQPTYLGDAIPVSGISSASHDK